MIERVKLHDAIQYTLAEVSERFELGGIQTVVIPTGFKYLDAALNGLRNSALYVLGGRSGMGKTSLAYGIALNIAKQLRRTLFFSFEMDANLLALRALSAMSGVPGERIERGQMSKEELEKVRMVQAETKDLTFDIVSGKITSEELTEYLQKERVDVGLDFVVIDHVDLLADNMRFGSYDRMSQIAVNLALAARTTDLPILALAQLSRAVEQRENHVPILSDLRESGKLEENAFAVLFTYRPHYYAMMFDGAEPVEVEKDAKIIIAKNRQGELGQLTVDFFPAQMRWADRSTKVVIPSVGDGPLTRKVKEHG